MARQSKKSGELIKVVGDRGESIFELAITDYSLFSEPLFHFAFLGDKWLSADYLVELVGVKGLVPFFFAQVKSTTKRIVNNRLSVRLPPEKRLRLFRIPGPTYVVGIHEQTRRTFIRAVIGESSQGIYDIPESHELMPDKLKVLYDEVVAFWKDQSFKPTESAFA